MQRQDTYPYITKVCDGDRPMNHLRDFFTIGEMVQAYSDFERMVNHETTNTAVSDDST